MERRLYEASLTGDVKLLASLIEEDPLALHRASLASFDETPLHISSLCGHIGFTRELLRWKPQLASELDSCGRTPLHLASAEGHVQVVCDLLSINSDACSIRDQDGFLPLHFAAIKGRDEVIPHLVQALPESTTQTLDGGDTVFHLCVKHNRGNALKKLVQLLKNEVDLVMAKDDGGNTILHLAASLKHLEIIKFLLSEQGIQERANVTNLNGFTALDVLEQCPRDLKGMKIQNILLKTGVKRYKDLLTLQLQSNVNITVFEELNKLIALPHVPSNGHGQPWHFLSNCWKLFFENDDNWMTDARGTLLVTATLTASMAFQAMLSPPGGVWQDSSDGYEPGKSIAASTHKDAFIKFLIFDTVTLVASLTTILLLISGFPINTKASIWLLVLTISITIAYMACTYVCTMILISPGKVLDEVGNALTWVLSFWVGVSVLVTLVHTARLLVWLRNKVTRFFIVAVTGGFIISLAWQKYHTCKLS